MNLEEERSGRSPAARPRWLVLVLRLLVSGALIAALFVFLPGAAILSSMSRASPRLLATVLLGFLAGHVVAALKWRILLSATGLRLSVPQAIRAHGAGLFANLFLPSLVGGDALRTMLAARPSGKMEVALVATMADRVLDTLALFVLMGAAALLLPGAFTATTARLLGWVIGFLMVGGAAAGAAVVLAPRWLPRSWRKRAESARGAVLAVASRPIHAATALGLALAVQSGFVLLNVYLGRAVGLELPLVGWFFLWPLAKLVALAPVSFGGIGVREAAFASLVTPFSVAPTLAVAQSLLWEAVLIVGGACGGLWWLLSSDRRILGLRRKQPC